MGYYVGTLANVLPLPGRIGGVEGGMIGSFLAFGVEKSLAVIAVLGYRTISYWLPTIPGAIAYLRLRRQFRQSGGVRRPSGPTSPTHSEGVTTVHPTDGGSRAASTGTDPFQAMAHRRLHNQPATVWARTTAESNPTTATQTVATARKAGPFAASPSTERRLARIRM